jgi:hypothetical protein
MANQQAIDYITQQTHLGVSREVINANFIAQGWLQSDIDDAFNALSFVTPQTAVPNNKKWKIAAIILGSIVAIFIALMIIGTYAEDQPSNNSQSLGTEKDSVSADSTVADSDISFSLLGDVYKKGFTLPGGGADFTAKAFEWVKANETVYNWKTLVTTHKLSPLSLDEPISAKSYAANVISMQKKAGLLLKTLLLLLTEKMLLMLQLPRI